MKRDVRLLSVAFILFGAALLGFVAVSDRVEIRERGEGWSIALRSAASPFLSAGDLVRLSALIRSEPRYSVLVCNSKNQPVLATGAFEVQSHCDPNGGDRISTLVLDSRPVGTLTIRDPGLLEEHLIKYLIIMMAWLSSSIALSTILARRGDLHAIDEVTAAIHSGELEQRVLALAPRNPRIRRLLDTLIESIRNKERLQTIEVESQTHRALAEISTQVAHDIRSPLAALNAVLSVSNALAPDEVELLGGAAHRIRDIAENLLSSARTPEGTNLTRTVLSLEAIFPILQAQAQEAQLQYLHRRGLVVEISVDDEAREVRARIHPGEFRRTISNLINNAGDAISDTGRITIHLGAEESRIRVTVADTGRGIPPSLIDRLGERGLSFGKAHGNGLGLYHARQALAAWAGVLEIQSIEGRGTTITIVLPRAI